MLTVGAEVWRESELFDIDDFNQKLISALSMNASLQLTARAPVK